MDSGSQATPIQGSMDSELGQPRLAQKVSISIHSFDFKFIYTTTAQCVG
ncbi:hypothetical protein COLO4_13784 [Corchorus olitorius]|uniref:Uncharacterized protein n=1 Tax=Corchorus olitorius TaxID=93759 RepID=A0A1R3JUX9_9ROSI|nr:hypothetical protein COLO4_13784 [Corchorus olitorius]